MNIKLTEEIKQKIVDSLQSKEIQKILKDIKGSKSDNGKFEMIVSTETKDRAGEIVKQDGMDISFYKKNPVVLWAHNYSGMPIGITDKIIKKGKQTIAIGRFAPTEEAQQEIGRAHV